MIVEIAKDIGGDKYCKRFDWNETIPVEVSEFPKILLRGEKLKWAHALFTPQEWDAIFCFIARNRNTIEQHWFDEIDSLTLLETVCRNEL